MAIFKRSSYFERSMQKHLKPCKYICTNMDIVQNKLVLVFNKFYYDFVQDICTTCPTLKAHFKIKVKDLQNTKYSKSVFQSLGPDMLSDICKTDIDAVFELDTVKPVQLYKGLSIETLIKEVPTEYHTTLRSYLYIFVVLKLVYDITLDDTEDTDESDLMNSVSSASIIFDKVMECIKLIQKKETYAEIASDILDDNIKIILSNLDKVMNIETDISSNDEAFDMLNGTKIGSLAQEISKDFDLSEFNISKPEDIMNLTKNNMLGNIINKVGSKMQEKIESGEIKHEDFIKEALGMFSNMNKSSPMFNNPMMQSMFKNMKNAKVNEPKLKEASTRERLRKKLASQTQTQTQTQTQSQAQEDA